MHIMEGFLPLPHALGWTIASAPFVLFGARRVIRLMSENSETRTLLGVSGGYTFILSALKLPSLTGSCSHATGVGLGTLLFGPPVMAVLGTLVLLFQALLMAHGGLTTLGANVFSMAVVGPWVTCSLFSLAARLRVRQDVAVFIAATLGDLATYVVTSLQLSLAFPSETGGFGGALAKFLGIFAMTQIPLAICEGLITVVALRLLSRHARDELLCTRYVPEECHEKN